MGTQGGSERAGRVFYPERRGVAVTGRYLRVAGRRFAIGDLAAAGWCRGSVQQARWAVVYLIGVETLLVAVVGAISAVVYGASVWFAIAGAVDVLVAGGVLWFGAQRWPTPLQLWAYHRGVPTLLFMSMDETEFHQVRRALQRAIEADRELAY